MEGSLNTYQEIAWSVAKSASLYASIKFMIRDFLGVFIPAWIRARWSCICWPVSFVLLLSFFYQLVLHLVIIWANSTILYHLTPQVVEVYSNGNFLLVEVISAKLDGNGTITTAVDINILKSHNRRSRRSTRYDFESASFKPDGIHHKVQLLFNSSAKVL